MKTHRIRQMALLLLMGLVSTGLAACMPKQPKVAQHSQAEPSVSAQTALGGFNLQKRHGLGGWDKPAGPSEAELMRRLAASKTALTASIQPTGKGTR